jgi:hypothetical protein
MPYLGGVFGLVTLALWIFALADLICTDEGGCRHLPKTMWLMIVLFVPLAGSVLWLAVGRPQRADRPRVAPYERAQPSFPEYDRSGRFAATNPEDDEEFLRRCRERAEEQRRKARGESQ